MTKLFKAVPLDTWFRISFKLSCFEDAGANLGNILAPLVVATTGLGNEQTSALRWSRLHHVRRWRQRNPWKAWLSLTATSLAVLASVMIVSSILDFLKEPARAQRELAQQQAEKTSASHDFLRNVLSHTVHPGYGEQTRVADILDGSSAGIAEAFPDEPEVEAESTGR